MEKLAAKMTLALLAYFSPVHEIFALMMGFVAVDLITGIAASSHRHVPRSSRRLRKSVLKLICYIGAVLLAFWAERVLSVEWLAPHRLVAGFICAVEFLSVLENFAVITGHPVFIKLIKLIRGRSSDDVLKEIIDEKNENFYRDPPDRRPDDERLPGGEGAKPRRPIGFLRERDGEGNPARHDGDRRS